MMSEQAFEDEAMAGTTFRDVDLTGAKFVDADLSSARFEDVRLHGAIIKNADLSDVTMTDVNISGLTIEGIEIAPLVTAASQEGNGARLRPEMVQEFVGVCHGNLDRVKDLLALEPKLVNASWDWGGGDWETGLGAAAHTGQTEIAQLLLAHGARMDIFAAAMLGKLNVVTAILEVHPEALHAPGPHGIPLIVHAQMGGDAASEVLSYLNALT